MDKPPKQVPEIIGALRKHRIAVPECIYQCSGIRINGRRVKSLVFTTDVAIIRNINADAVIAVYPFTPQPVITQSLMMGSDKPVFCGVGGGTTTGPRVVVLAEHAEHQGAMGVVVNAPTSNETLELIRERIDIPIVLTVVNDQTDYTARIRAGATILNVSGASQTPQLVRAIRRELPDVPIIATGGPTEESILETIAAGANAITYTPPSSAELFKGMMEKYREQII